MQQTFDVIVVGGGHAGTEAALAAARSGAKTLLLTQNIETIGQMSCNPAIGGIGKSHLVREIDAMGGVMARAADLAGIQFRILNRRKGPAVRATRAQTDRVLYRQAIRSLVENQPDLVIFQQEVDDLIVEHGRVQGVVTRMGQNVRAQAVVLTVGTFLGGRIFVGSQTHQAGRAGDAASIRLADRLRELPLGVDRLKTGTPPRIDGKTIDYSKMETQPGDQPLPVFSFMGNVEQHPRQVNCHITYTNERTHKIIRDSLHESPMYSGAIQGVGPRYCPSIEDKVTRFADRDRHQIFIEPEGLNTHEVYPNGISTSLPYEAQLALVHSVAGLEQCHITRPGYAIEYDYFESDRFAFESANQIPAGLFFAGQINGTTGYEEAAAQGLMAGINAARWTQQIEPVILGRDQAYTGVMIDDLVTRGTSEPYRMFTSRAEYRLVLREDNADLRLTPLARELGIIDEQRWQRFSWKRDTIAQEQARLDATFIQPGQLPAERSTQLFGNVLEREYSLTSLLRRPETRYRGFAEVTGLGPLVDDAEVIEQLEIQAKYAGYMQRQQADIEKTKRMQETVIPSEFDYSTVKGLSNEVLQKLSTIRPHTISQAARISGVTPAAVSLLVVHLKARGQMRKRGVSSVELQQELAAGAAQLGITTTTAQVNTLFAYIALLQKWNSAFNLVGTSNAQELVQKHLLDSIAIGPFIKNSPILDVGTGAGLPGIPLAITLPELSFRLLDANNKKVRFMRQAAIELNLSNIEIIHSRVENYRPEQAPRTVITRAFAPLEKALNILSTVCADGGQVLLMLGERTQQLQSHPAYTEITTHAIRVPGLQSQRHLLVASKK